MNVGKRCICVEEKYDIVMTVPIGKRHGNMYVQINGDEISGTIDILGASESFSGTIQNDGCFEIIGNLKTLVSTIPYHSTGKITTDEIELTLLCPKNKFYITGKVTNENETIL